MRGTPPHTIIETVWQSPQRKYDTHALPIVLKVPLGRIRRKAAQEPNQHRKRIFWLCLERMFVATHEGRRSRKLVFGWDGVVGGDAT
jgi:hypothetical protein